MFPWKAESSFRGSASNRINSKFLVKFLVIYFSFIPTIQQNPSLSIKIYQAFQFLLMKIFNYNLIKRPDIAVLSSTSDSTGLCLGFCTPASSAEGSGLRCDGFLWNRTATQQASLIKYRSDAVRTAVRGFQHPGQKSCHATPGPFLTATICPLPTALEKWLLNWVRVRKDGEKFCGFEQTQRTCQLMVALNNSPP